MLEARSQKNDELVGMLKDVVLQLLKPKEESPAKVELPPRKLKKKKKKPKVAEQVIEPEPIKSP